MVLKKVLRHPIFWLKRACHIINFWTVDVGMVDAVSRAGAVGFLHNWSIAGPDTLRNHKRAQAWFLLFLSVLLLLSLCFQFALDGLIFD